MAEETRNGAIAGTEGNCLCDSSVQGRGKLDAGRKGKRCGILALVFGLLFPPLGLVFALAALMFGFSAIDASEGETSCKPAIVCGLLGLFLSLKIGFLEYLIFLA